MKYFFLFILFFTTERLFPQRMCSFQIDTTRILKNQNLDSFLAELKTDIFKITNDKKDIPKFIKKQLDCYVGRFRIANPDQPYNATDLIVRNWPERQVIFLAKSEKVFVMEYYLGGISLSRHLLLVKYRDGQIVDLWKGFCFEEFKSINDVVNYLELNRNKKWGLNTNVIYF